MYIFVFFLENVHYKCNVDAIVSLHCLTHFVSLKMCDVCRTNCIIKFELKKRKKKKNPVQYYLK